MMNQNFEIRKGFENMHMDEVMQLLGQTHWACNRKRETVERALSNSLCFGIFNRDNRQVGMARTVTDYATIFYVSDLVIDRQYHELGLGKMMVEAILTAEELKNLWGFLGTTKAKDFYTKFGFEENKNFFLSLPKTNVDGIFNV